MYWPNMTQHIDKTVSKCGICLLSTVSAQETHNSSHGTAQPVAEISSRHNDDWWAGLPAHVDYSSKYSEIPILQDKAASSVVHNLKSVFVRYGMPEEVIRDNVPFASRRVAKFAQEWGFTVTTTSPCPRNQMVSKRRMCK